MDNFQLLGPLAAKLHEDFRNVYYMVLPVFFMLSLVVVWVQNPTGGPDFLETVKRAIVATLLLVGFSEISDAILSLTQGLSTRISDMSGLDAIMQMAGEKAKTYTLSSKSLLNGFNDSFMATLSFVSFLLLYVARYLMLAVYHFTWMFLTIMAPILLLFHLFSPRMTLNLFKSLIEVASWQVVWAALSAMLKALPFGNAYSVEGDYLTVILINIVIALAILGTPLIVRSLVGSGFSAVAGSLGPASVATMMALPTRAVTGLTATREFLNLTPAYFARHASNLGKNHLKYMLPSLPSREGTPRSPSGRPGPPTMPPPPRAM